MNSLNERTRNKLYTATEEVFCLMDKYSERLQNYFIEFIYEELFSLTKGIFKSLWIFELLTYIRI